MFFALTHKDKNSNARAGVIHTDHGDIETPMFMPVGTQASVKTLDSTDVENIGAQIILGNTYHLHLRPGEDLIAEQGGLHKFMNWNKPMLTDSGGFQVFSLGAQKNKKTKKQKSKTNDEPVLSPALSTAVEREAITPPLPQPEGPPRRVRGQGEDSSQGRLVEIDEEGVTFKSYIDGSTHRFTPEEAINIQHKLGADIIMAFDECTPDDAERIYVKEAMDRTHRWAKRSLGEHRRLADTPSRGSALARRGVLSAESSLPSIKAQKGRTPRPDERRSDPLEGVSGQYRQFLFGIIQGANYKDLREESAKYISSLDFDGIAIGGESIGYNMEATANILDWVYPLIPENKPHYAMGVGLSPLDLLIAVEHGVDMFDCVGPTRIARHGMVFVSPHPDLLPRGEGVANPLPTGEGRVRGSRFRLNLNNSQFTKDLAPIDENCDCSTCKNYSRSYLHHLFAANEMTGMRLATIHNLKFMIKLMEDTRRAILEDRFTELKNQWL